MIARKLQKDEDENDPSISTRANDPGKQSGARQHRNHRPWKKISAPYRKNLRLLLLLPLMHCIKNIVGGTNLWVCSLLKHLCRVWKETWCENWALPIQQSYGCFRGTRIRASSGLEISPNALMVTLKLLQLNWFNKCLNESHPNNTHIVSLASQLQIGNHNRRNN